jgi:DNA repair protein RecO (recombination protein O)
MKQLETEAIILKRLNFGEADRILTVLTPQNGKISLIAKGVRRAKSKLAGGLELFSISEISYIDGKSDIKTIVSTRLKSHFKLIVSDVSRTMIGYDFMKIIDSLTEHTEEAKYYELLSVALNALNDSKTPTSTVEVWFYFIALQINGNSINIEKPLGKFKFEQEQSYEFSYDDMSFYPQDNGTFTSKHIKYLRLVSRASEPSKLSLIQGNGSISIDIRDIIKQSAIMHKA